MQSSPGQPFRSGTGHRFRDDDVGAERQVRSMRFDCAGRQNGDRLLGRQIPYCRPRQ